MSNFFSDYVYWKTPIIKNMLLREAQKNCAAAAAVAAAGGVPSAGSAGGMKKKSTSSTSLYKDNGILM